jgi:2-iminobutanoate/2-iminopropanoate deaminase
MTAHPLTGNNIPKSSLPFSPAFVAGDFVFVSGQASVDDQGSIVSDTFQNEMDRSMQNVIKILAQAGLTLRDVIQCRCYVAQSSDLEQYNQLYQQYFRTPFPTRTTLVNCLGSLIRFEIDVIAYRGGK